MTMDRRALKRSESTGRRRDGGGLRETDPPNFSFRTNNCSFYSGSKALGEEVLAGADNLFVWRLRIPFNEVDSPRNYLTKLMRYDRLLEAENSLSQLEEFVRATWECWEKRVPFGTYNVTNPGAVTTREVVDLIKKSGVAGVWLWFSRFYEEAAEFHQLKNFRAFIEDLRQNVEVYNMHGGYLSLALSRFGLNGVSHGIGYGEQKDVIPVIGQSTPTVRYYLPDLHRRLGVPQIERALKGVGVKAPEDFFAKVCDCAICQGYRYFTTRASVAAVCPTYEKS